jgi:hypothetical protein
MTAAAVIPMNWGATPDEMAARYPVDDVLPDAACDLFRAVGTTATPESLFRWLCQLRVAPYSYDLIDNRGRRSPRVLSPGADRLREGDRIAHIFELVSFEPGVHVTMRLHDRFGQVMFGPVGITYAIRPGRLVAKLRIGRRGDGPLQAARRHALAWGDLVMMRRQLLTLRDLAERTGPVGSPGAAA